MIVGTLWNLFWPWPLSVWSIFWHWVPVIFAVVTGVWFTWGGIVDSFDLFRRLRGERINTLDNGVVINHQNLDETTGTLPTRPD